MLVKFIVSNFKSISKEQEFTMVAGAKRNHYDHIYEFDNVKILKGSAFYGSNSAGKTSIVDAFSVSKKIITDGLENESTDYSGQYCRTKSENKTKTTHFEYMIEVDKELFYYGFEVVLSELAIKKEWLYKYEPINDNEIEIYSIDYETGESNYPYFESSDEEKNSLRFHYESAVNDNILLLKQVGKMKFIEENSVLYVIKKVYQWFKNKLYVGIESKMYKGDYLSSFNKIVNRMKLDICDSKLVECDDVDSDIASSVFNALTNALKIDKKEDVDFYCPGYSFSLKDNKLTVREVHTKHRSSNSEFNIREESKGTLELIELIPMIYPECNDCTFIIDEFGSNLHPVIAPEVIKAFYELNADNKCQLIVATHQTSIMTSDIFRSDEIWMVDKKDGESEFYSLADFNIRSDIKWDRQYLEGRFGALPIFSDDGGPCD